MSENNQQPHPVPPNIIIAVELWEPTPSRLHWKIRCKGSASEDALAVAQGIMASVQYFMESALRKGSPTRVTEVIIDPKPEEQPPRA